MRNPVCREQFRLRMQPVPARQMIEAAIVGMQTIQTKVGLSVQKVREMGKRSEQIDTIVETIDQIASQTNLLALNAAIRKRHGSSQKARQ